MSSVIKIALDEDAKAPAKGHLDDVGWDLFVYETQVLKPHRFTLVDSGIVSIELPQGTWGMIVGRSSTWLKKGLMVDTGIIDNGYRGPLYAKVYNPQLDDVIIEEGERVAQLILMNQISDVMMAVDPREISRTTRGQSGFGSTGR